MSEEKRPKVIVVLGTTAVGKTKFSVSLARALETKLDRTVEIVGCDSVQIYDALPILCDSITEEEACGVTHHLIGFRQPCDEYKVHNFVKDARQKIHEIVEDRGNIALLTGGTLYYTEALLFPAFVSDPTQQSDADVKDDDHSCSMRMAELDRLNNQELWESLNKVDPSMAKLYPPNDRRRVRRSLEVYHSKGVAHSTLLETQQGSLSQLRCVYDSLVFWLDCSNDVIDSRIDSRLIEMEKNGVFEEVSQFSEKFMVDHLGYDALKYFDIAEDERSQRICMIEGFGFQAFMPWLKRKKHEHSKDNNSDDDADGQLDEREIRDVCLKRYSIETKRYARKQKRWLRNRILKMSDRLSHLFQMDTSDKTIFNDTVVTPAIQISVDFLENRLESSPKIIAEDRRDAWQTELFTCDLCCKSNIRGKNEWSQHLKSKAHRKKTKHWRGVLVPSTVQWFPFHSL